MKYIIVLALVALMLLAVFAGSFDFNMSGGFLALSFDTEAQTEQVRLRENGETERLRLREAAASERYGMLVGLFQFAVAAGVIALLIFIGWRLAAQAMVLRAMQLQVAQRGALAASELPNEVQERLSIIVNQVGDGGFVDVDGDEYVYVHPASKTVATLASASPQRRLTG